MSNEDSHWSDQEEIVEEDPPYISLEDDEDAPPITTQNEQHLFELLNIEPEEQLHDLAVRHHAVTHPELFCRRYAFNSGPEYPLRQLCTVRMHVETLEAVYNAHPDAIWTKDTENEYTMIHVACFCGQPPDIISKLVQLDNGRALQEPDSGNALPLHVACDELWIETDLHTDVQVIQLLVENFRGALEHRDCRGQTPLHVAASAAHARVETLEYLIRENPSLTAYRDERGDWPIHCAAQSANSQVSLLQVLLRESPQNFLTRGNFYGETPLHYACRASNTEKISLLLRAGPEAARIRDRLENLPIHAALFRPYCPQCSLAVLEELLAANPSESFAGEDKSPFMRLWLNERDSLMDAGYPRETLAFQSLELMIRYHNQSQNHTEVLSPLLAMIRCGGHIVSLDFFAFGLRMYSDDIQQRDAANSRSGLYWAIEWGLLWDQGLKELVRTVPNLLEWEDPVSKLCPTLHAATVNCPLDTVYELLRILVALFDITMLDRSHYKLTNKLVPVMSVTSPAVDIYEDNEQT